MEELRLAVIKLQKNIKELAVADEAIKDVIRCNSKNLESLKNLTLDINERVKVMEDGSNENLKAPDLVIIKKDMTNLESKIDTVEEKLVDGIKNTIVNVENKVSQSNVNTERDRRNLKELLLANERKIREVEKNLQIQTNKMKVQEKSFKCEECGEVFEKKKCLKIHIQIKHPKYIKCESCDETFKESWQYETHLESHSKTKDKKCDVCGKLFFLDWRLGQHMNIHKKPHVKNCHYFNNQKVCPYDAIGCKFNHVMSKECKNQANCQIKLCSLQHTRITSVTKNIVQ